MQVDNTFQNIKANVWANNVLHVTCTVCGLKYALPEVDRVSYELWRAGQLIQKVMPNISEDARELLISGTCGPCFDRMFDS